MTTKQQARSLRAFADFFNAIGRDEDAENAQQWADQLEGRRRTRKPKNLKGLTFEERLSSEDVIRARGLGVLLK